MSGKTGPQPPWIQPHAKDTVGEEGLERWGEGLHKWNKVEFQLHSPSQPGISEQYRNQQLFNWLQRPDLQRRKHPQSNGVAGCLVIKFNSVATPRTVARQAPLSMGFSRQEYWSGLPFPSPGDLPHTGIKPAPTSQADSLPLSHRVIAYLQGKPRHFGERQGIPY